MKSQQVNLFLTTVNSRENADVEVVALEVVTAKSGMGKASVIQLTLESCKASASGLISKNFASIELTSQAFLF